MKSNTLVFLLIAAGLAAAYFLTRGKTGAVQGTGSRFTSTGTAQPPGFWGLGAAPGGIFRIQAPANAPAWASVASASVNALGDLAAKYWRPNRSVETSGSGRADASPTYSTQQDYFQALSDAAVEQNQPNSLTSQYEADIPDPDIPDFQEELI